MASLPGQNGPLHQLSRHYRQDQVGQDENQQESGQEPGVDAQTGQQQSQQESQKDAVSRDDGIDYVAQLKAKDAEIEALQAKVAKAAKTA